MDYSDEERQILNELERTNFKNISKQEILSFASKIGQLRPEVAKEAIKQFPEFSNMVCSIFKESIPYLKQITDSDDKSVEFVYKIILEQQKMLAQENSEYYKLVNNVQKDISKCLDAPDLTQETRDKLIDSELKIVQEASKREEEQRKAENKIVDKTIEKDSEHKAYNWNKLSALGSVVLIGIGLSAAMLSDGKFEIKLPSRD